MRNQRHAGQAGNRRSQANKSDQSGRHGSDVRGADTPEAMQPRSAVPTVGPAFREIRALLERSGFRFSRSMGQNFLCDRRIPPRIAEAAELDGNTGVLEVGPGVGCLTVELARRAGRVLSVELDDSLRTALAETLRGLDNVEVYFTDILKAPLSRLCRETFPGCSRVVVCANLPYQITTPVLRRFAETMEISEVTVMIQREVARRICAVPDTPEYGSLSLLMQWYFTAVPCFDVPPGCF